MLKNVKDNNKNFLLHGSILAIAGLIVRFIGLLYRIPMVSIIGATGNGYYTSAYSIYSFFLILSSYSFPNSISKLISQRLANDRYKDIKKLISVSFLLAFLIGILMFCIMFFGARVIALSFQKEKLVFALRALAPTLFIMAFLSVIRGVFQGMGNMIPTAISQIVEQVFNAVFSIVMAFNLFNKGVIANLIYETTDYEYAFGAAGGAIGTGVGAFSALVLLLFMFFSFISSAKRYMNDNNGYKVESTSNILFSLFSTIVPIIVSAAIYNVSSIVDDLVFSNAYALLNKKNEMVGLWGVYGQYHLLFNIPVAVASSISASIIPSISTSVARNDAREVVMKIKYSMKYTLLIVAPAFVGLMVLSDPISRLLFDGEYVEILIRLLQFGSIAVVTYAFSTVSIGILHGLGYYTIPVYNSVIALVIHLIVMLVMILFMNLGIFSVVYANVVFSFIVFLLNQMQIDKVVRYKKGIIKNYIMPIVCSIIMGFVVFLVYNFLNNTILSAATKFNMIIKLLVSVGLAVVIYGILIMSLGVVTKRDSEYIPFVKRFFR